MPRIQPPAPEDMTPAQREIHDAILSGPRGSVAGPLGIWLTRPELAAPAQALGRYCRFDSALPPELSEIAICIVGRFWRAEYEWWAHKRMALDAGVSREVLDAIRDGDVPPLQDAKAEAVYDVTVALLHDKRLDKTLYDRALAALGQDALVDLVAIVGYYCLVSVTLNAFEVELPEGETSELSPA
ncbi:MAG: carboxymuconolactone decarboxylase family protein [Pseudomonadota bacterium]